MARSTTQQDIRGGTRVMESAVGFQVPGGAQGIIPIQGSDALLTSFTAMAQQMGEFVKEVKVMNRRNEQMSAGDTRNVSDSVAKALGQDNEKLLSYLLGAGGEGLDNLGPKHDGSPSAPPKDPIAEYERLRGYFGDRRSGYSLGNLRQDVGTFAQDRLQNRIPTDPEGGGVADFGKRMAVTMAARGAAQTLAEGGTMRQAGLGAMASTGAGATLLKSAGVAGAVVSGANMVGDFLENQRKQNAEWQRMMGGTNLGATGERVGEKFFQLGLTGTMGAEDAAQLYKSVAATGLRGEDRTRAQDFAVSSYRQFGMTIEQSMQIIRTSAKTGQESLIGVSMALDRVTSSAATAEINTEKARQAFIDTYETFSGMIGGQAALTTAEGLSLSRDALGKGFDVQGGPGEQQQRIYAARRGLSYGAYLADIALPGNENMLLADRQAYTTETLGNMLSAGTKQYLEQFRPKVAAGTLTDEDKFNINQAVMRSPGFDPSAAMDILKVVSGDTNLTTVNIGLYVGLFYLGGVDALKAAEQAIDNAGTTQIQGLNVGENERGREHGSGGGSGLGGVEYGTMRHTKEGREELDALRKKVYASDVGGLFGTGLFNLPQHRIQEAFMNDVIKTGRRGGISEAIASNAELQSAAAKLVIRNANGEEEEVDLATAFSKYREQIDAGSARIGGTGDLSGRTVADAFASEGLRGDESLNGVITIKPHPSFEKWLDISATGSVFEGLTQGDPHRNPESRG